MVIHCILAGISLATIGVLAGTVAYVRFLCGKIVLVVEEQDADREFFDREIRASNRHNAGMARVLAERLKERTPYARTPDREWFAFTLPIREPETVTPLWGEMPVGEQEDRSC